MRPDWPKASWFDPENMVTFVNFSPLVCVCVCVCVCVSVCVVLKTIHFRIYSLNRFNSFTATGDNSRILQTA